jgi:hypothetical protein
MPTLCRFVEDIRRKGDIVILGPRDAFLNTEAAAMMPAIVRIATAALSVLTDKRPAAIFFGEMRDRQADDGYQVRKESKDRKQLAEEKAPEPSSSKPAHDELGWEDVNDSELFTAGLILEAPKSKFKVEDLHRTGCGPDHSASC